MIWWLVSFVGMAALERYFFRGRNAVWGGATLGAIVGVVVALARSGFDWGTVGQGAVIGSFIGLLAEILGAIGDRMRREG